MPWSARRGLPGSATAWSQPPSAPSSATAHAWSAMSGGAGQLSVTLHQTVADVAIERRTDLECSRPVLGGDRRFQRGDVRHVHRDESMLDHRRGATGVVAETQLAG